MLIYCHKFQNSEYTYTCNMVTLLHMPTDKKKNHSPTLPDVAVNIRGWRKHLGIKQSEIANKAGLSHNALSRIERGAVVSPQPQTLYRIAQALEMSYEALLFRPPPMQIAETIGRYEVAELATRLESLDEEKLEPVLDAFDKLLDQMAP